LSLWFDENGAIGSYRAVFQWQFRWQGIVDFCGCRDALADTALITLPNRARFSNGAASARCCKPERGA
jgi:hypothetical protein